MIRYTQVPETAAIVPDCLASTAILMVRKPVPLVLCWLSIVATIPICELSAAAEISTQTELGRALFFDTNLSLNRTQSCSTCHEPGRAFTDGRDSGVDAAVSLGDDGKSLGDRNAPGLTYVTLIPEFHVDSDREYVGGYFLDGRAISMTAQAAEPFINPLEMALPDHGVLVNRVRENPAYVEAMQTLFSAEIFNDVEQALIAITSSIVEFERTDLFAPFDSKYDRYLRGEYELTETEEFGRLLFFSQLINCSSCHLADEREFEQRESFSNNLYHNIGVPPNNAVRDKNGLSRAHRDTGLLQNPAVDDPAQAGKIRVPGLRNVAVTGPYMHNGVFQDLETVIRFYNHFILDNQESMTNPETGERWRIAEVNENLALELLRDGQPMRDDMVTAVEAFLRTLTDKRYESLLE